MIAEINKIQIRDELQKENDIENLGQDLKRMAKLQLGFQFVLE